MHISAPLNYQKGDFMNKQAWLQETPAKNPVSHKSTKFRFSYDAELMCKK